MEGSFYISSAFADVGNVARKGLVDASRRVVISGDAAATAVPISGTVTVTGVATEATLATRLAEATFTTRINTQGQKAMAASTPVVIASDQSAVPISGSVSITGSVTVTGTVAATQSGAWDITNITGTVSLPTDAASATNQATMITALQLIDNLPHAANVAFSNGVPIMGQLDDTATGAVTENNVGAVRITGARGLHVNLRDNGGAEIGTAGAPVRVDPTGSTTQPVSGTVSISGTVTVTGTVTVGNAAGASAVNIQDGGNSITVDGSVSLAAAIPAGTNNIGDVDVLSLPALPAGSNNIGDVDVLTLPALPAGTNNIGDVDIVSLPNEGQQTMANSISVAIASDQTVLPVGGNVAHNAADSGNPVKIGGKGVSAEPTAVDANDRVDAYFDQQGYQHNKVRPVEDAGTTPTNINTTYNNTTTSATSADITKIAGAQTLHVIMTLAKANTPTDIEFFIDYKDGSNYFPWKTGILAKWIYDDTYAGTTPSFGVDLPAPPAGIFRMRAVANGVDASNTFTVSNCKIFQRT